MLRALFKYNGFRNFSQSRILRNIEKSQLNAQTKAPEVKDFGVNDVVPSKFEKKILVWMGKFKSVEDIPGKVSPGTIQYVRSRFRIRIVNFMMVGTVIMLLFYIFKGKKLSAAGDSTKRRHMEMNERILANSNK